MTTISGAVVNDFYKPPSYTTLTLGSPRPSQVRIRVLTAGLHPLVRSRARGIHYSVHTLPHVPGIDGVGLIPETQQKVYFFCFSSPTGSFAEYINVDRDDVFELPDGADQSLLAAEMNPAMSSWMALRARAKKGEGADPFSVLILGATGAAGMAAVQV